MSAPAPPGRRVVRSPVVDSHSDEGPIWEVWDGDRVVAYDLLKGDAEALVASVSRAAVSELKKEADLQVWKGPPGGSPYEWFSRRLADLLDGK